MLTLWSRKAKNSYIDKPKQTVMSKKRHTVSTKSICQFILTIILCGIICFIIILLVFQSYRYATTSDFFSIKEVKIYGATHLVRQDIINETNLHYGVNSLNINISEIEKKLHKNPWISSVSIKRHLPNTFEIRINERKASFWIRIKDTLFYTDIDGNIIAPVEMENFISLPTLKIAEDGEALQKTIGGLLKSFHEMRLPLDMAMVSSIRLSKSEGVEIIVGDRQLTLFIQPEDWKANLLRLNSVMQDLAQRGELRSTRKIYVFGGNAWVEKK